MSNVWCTIKVVCFASAALVACSGVARADLVPFIGVGVRLADPFPSPTNVYGGPLAPNTWAVEPVNDTVNAPAVPWLDEVEWIVLGAPLAPVQFVFLPPTVGVSTFVAAIPAGLYVYVAYTQPDDFGAELGGSNFLVGNLSTFPAMYGLGITEAPFVVPPNPPIPPNGPLIPGPFTSRAAPTGTYNGATIRFDGTGFIVTVGPVPEPMTSLFVGIGLTALLYLRRRGCPDA